MTERTVCPASGKRCACAEGSIRWLECRGVALETAQKITSGWFTGGQAGQARALELRAKGSQR